MANPFARTFFISYSLLLTANHGFDSSGFLKNSSFKFIVGDFSSFYYSFILIWFAIIFFMLLPNLSYNDYRLAFPPDLSYDLEIDPNIGRFNPPTTPSLPSSFIADDFL